MTLPAWDPVMSEGCVIPHWLTAQIGVSGREREACHPASVELDRAYYEGGTDAERELAEAAFRDAVTPYIGEFFAATWYEAIRTRGAEHWGTGRTWDGRRLGAT